MRRILPALLSLFALLSLSHAQGVATSEFCHAYATNKDYNGVQPFCEDTKVTASPGPAPATVPHPQAQVKGGISCSSTATFAAVTFTVYSDLACPSPPGHSVLNSATSHARLTGSLWTGESDSSYGQDEVNGLDLEVLAGDNDCNTGPFFETLVPLNMSVCNEAPPPPPPPPPPYCGTPIIIDTAGEGFHLTSAKDGVIFDLRGDGSPLLRWAWTAPGSRNAFLALDRNGDGRIESGKELFGNFTAQSDCPADQRNGFRALAEYDLPANGGNGDGVIDERDEVFKHLRLWIDRNHDGVSQPDELYTLPQLGVTSLGLAYTEQLPALSDEFGNWFRLKGQVNPEGQPLNDHVDRVMYDVYLRARTLGDPVGGTNSHLGGAASVTPAGTAGVDLPCCNGGTCGGG